MQSDASLMIITQPCGLLWKYHIVLDPQIGKASKHILTGNRIAGTVPIELAAARASRSLSDRRLLPSRLPMDSGKPSSSPTLKPICLEENVCEGVRI